MRFFIACIHLFIAIVLTVVTQVGGLLYLLCLGLFRKKGKRKYIYFLGIYLLFTFIIIPLLAPLGGRERIKNSEIIQPRNYFYVLANRNYVTPQLNATLEHVSKELHVYYPGLEVVYLDANFPFIDGFPLLPHLSHNDGKKIDVNFIYNREGSPTNKKPSLSGYGAFVEPKTHEHHQPNQCEAKGYWQYDFTKYVTFGIWNNDLELAEQPTQKLLQFMLSDPETSKVFIEPHIKNRLRLGHPKLRYHGCQAVRHDDHIHLQIR